MYERTYNYPPYYQGNPYYFHPYNQNSNYSMANSKSPANYQTPFEMFSKPKQPMNWHPYAQSGETFYPPPKTNNLLHYFKDNNGEVDLDKMFSTVGQLATTFQQITPVVKQVGSIMQQFK